MISIGLKETIPEEYRGHVIKKQAMIIRLRTGFFSWAGVFPVAVLVQNGMRWNRKMIINYTRCIRFASILFVLMFWWRSR